MKIEERIDKFIGEAKNVILTANIKKKINTAIRKLTTPNNKTKYFDKIPLQDFMDILKKFNTVILQEDNTLWDGFLTGNQATVDFTLAPMNSLVMDLKNKIDIYTPYTNASLRFQWYKMDSGRYEITAYVG